MNMNMKVKLYLYKNNIQYKLHMEGITKNYINAWISGVENTSKFKHCTIQNTLSLVF